MKPEYPRHLLPLALTSSFLLAVATPSGAGLLAHWAFDEGSGTTAADSSGNGLTATTTASTTWVAGVSGTAANNPKFTLSDSSSLALADGNTAFTISLWANTTVNDDFAVLAGFEGTGGGGDRYSIKIDTIGSAGMIQAELGGAIASDSIANLSNGNWVHIVAVNDPGEGNSKIYIDGALDNTGSVVNLSSTVSEWTMGTYWNSGGYDYTGALDDVQVYDQALTAGDVAFLFANPGSVLGGGPATIALAGAPADSITDDGATVECQVLNDDADAVTVVWAETDEGETDISTWTSATGGGSHSFGAASQDDVLSHAITGLDGDTVYFFRFFGTAGADSDWSSAGSFATGLGGSPAPADLAGTPDTTTVGTKVDLTWTDGYTNETGFLIQRSTDPGFGGTPDEFSVGADETSFTDDTTEANTTYYYRIAAEGASGLGPFSDNFEVTTGDDPPSGLIGHWTFDDGSGTVAADSAGSGYDADVHATEGGSDWITGKAGGAYEQPRFTLDATESDALNLPGGNVTLSVWVTAHNTAQFAGIAGFEGTGSSGDIYSLKMDNADKINWTVLPSHGPLPSADTLANYAAATGDGWVHVVGVFEEGVGSTLYVNGSVAATGGAGSPIPDKTTPGLFRIGTYYNSNSYEFNGAIDDVQLYNYAVSADDVSFLYSNPGSVLGEAVGIELSITPNGAGYDFSWDSKDGKVYDLVTSTDLLTAPEDWPVWDSRENLDATPPTNSLTGVPGGGPVRFFAVVEKDPPPLFSENFDAAAALPAGWASTGPSNGTDWDVGTPSGVPSGPTTADSAPNCAGTNVSGYYTENADVSLVSPSFAVPIGSGASLSFRQFIDTDLAGAPADLGSVRILDADNADTPIAGLEILAIEGDGSAGWTNASLALPSGDVGGKNIKIEFRFVSNAGTVEGTDVFSGFHVDDVLVTEVAP